MTDEEMDGIRERVMRAEVVRERLKKLREALSKIQLAGDAEVISLQFDLDANEKWQAIRYLRRCDDSDHKRAKDIYQNICYLEKEPGLAEEFRRAAIEILERRIADAETDYRAT